MAHINELGSLQCTSLSAADRITFLCAVERLVPTQ
jgi:hypothetical protein